ncbi:MAG: hypothetical protein ACLS61_10125 [Ruminococcus sp.]
MQIAGMIFQTGSSNIYVCQYNP